MQDVTISVNGREISAEIDERTLLLEFIRDVAGLTGTHNGCLEARCGCCSVEMDGNIVKSCNVLALQAHGKSVTGAGHPAEFLARLPDKFGLEESVPPSWHRLLGGLYGRDVAWLLPAAPDRRRRGSAGTPR